MATLNSRDAVKLLLFLINVFGLSLSSLVSQTTLDYMSEYMHVTAKVIDNLAFEPKKHVVRYTLHNMGNLTVPGADWILYFDSFRSVEPELLPYKGSVVMGDRDYRLSLIQGQFSSIEPLENFGDIHPNQSKEIQFFAKYWSISRYEFMPNQYVHSPGLEPRILKTTQTLDFADAFTDVRALKRAKDDRFNPFTPQYRMDKYKVTDVGRTGKLVLPTPMNINVDETHWLKVENRTWKIYTPNAFQNEAKILAETLMLPVINGAPQMHAIILSQEDLGLGAEGYTLQSLPDTNVIEIKGQTSDGVFYGVQTLLSLFLSYQDYKLPQLLIRDQPRFSYRGMHVDVSRHFHGVESIKRLLDGMTMYKMNKLHLHLTDDDGWRLEIPGLPELTEIGGKRCHDPTETRCISPQMGSGPFPNDSGTGFYSVEEYKDILMYAKERHIQVIPEFDMPGHAHAAIRAMEVRFTRLNVTGNTSAANKFRLADPDDSSIYLSIQEFTDNAINPCIESTYNFVRHLVETLVEIHSGVQPLEVFHFGGDEVAKAAWTNSSACDKLVALHPDLDSKIALKRYFVGRASNITAEFNLTLGGWEDGFLDHGDEPYPRSDMQNADVIANVWNNVWEWGSAMRAYRLANMGYKVVMSHATHLYFDHPQEPDPEEIGLNWATRYTDTKKVFSFLPDSLYDNIDTTFLGKPITKGEVCGANMSQCDALENEQNILGIQGQLWSEVVRTSDALFSQIFPRLLALAERAWHKASWEDIEDKAERERTRDADWELFANALGHKEFKRLESIGIHYRVPPPGGKVINGKLTTSTTYPTLNVQCSNDGGITWNDVTANLTWTDNSTYLLRTMLFSLRPILLYRIILLGLFVAFTVIVLQVLRSASTTLFSRPVEMSRIEPSPNCDQGLVDYLAVHLEVKYDVIDNINKQNDQFIAAITLKNQGKYEITRSKFRIYFYHMTTIETQYFPYIHGLDIKDCNFTLFHEQGNLFYLSPTAETYLPISPGKSVVCSIHAAEHCVSKYMVMPNWYVGCEAMAPKVIENTRGESLEFVGEFDSPKQWKRSIEDKYEPFTPRTRYQLNEASDYGSPGSLVLPTPAYVKQDGSKTISFLEEGWKVVRTVEFKREADILKEYFKIEEIDQAPAVKYIMFLNKPVLNKDGMESKHPEAYNLIVNPDMSTVDIVARSEAGAFDAVQSLLSLAAKDKSKIPAVVIRDEPRFAYRGVMVDVGRNFQPKSEILKLLDVMSMYKLNKFHFHLTDDEGWRIEIPGLPELTKFGSKRCHDPAENRCLLPSLGSGPDSSTSGTGYYTLMDYKEILKYAADRHIEIIPEVDMPGHARAAVRSMERRHFTSSPQNESYLLSEIGHRKSVLSGQMYTDSVMNPCLNSTYNFIHKIIFEFKRLHSNFQPLNSFHFGGDEVVHGVWKDSAACLSLQIQHPELADHTEIKRYFVRRVSKIAEEFGVNLAAWEGGLLTPEEVPFTREEFPQRDVYAYPYINIWERETASRAYKLANAGYKIVLSMATHLYLDHPYEPDPTERGFYWATRYISTRKVYRFMPDNIYANADTTIHGDTITEDDICNDQKMCTRLDKPDNVEGMEGHIWGETIRTPDQLEYMAFPRLLAVAEKAWHRAEWESEPDLKMQEVLQQSGWERFANTLGHKELLRLDQAGIQYRVPPPGAVTRGDTLDVKTAYPGLAVEISFTNGASWETVQDIDSTQGVNQVLLRTRSADNQRTSRVIVVNISGVTSSTSSSFLPSCQFLLIWFASLFLFCRIFLLPFVTEI